MKIYLTGQDNFGNRGCEALVRSNAMLLREARPDAEILVPSHDIERDKKQWRSASRDGIRFVNAIPVHKNLKWRGRLANRFDFLKSWRWPQPNLGHPYAKDITSADALVSIGGDNYSLDYGLVSLFHFVNVAEFALRSEKPSALWAASVGPFDKEPRVVQQVVEHLQRLSLVSVRETNSYDYLRGKGLHSNLIQVADSAFALKPEPFDVSSFWPKTDKPVVGLNVSPLIQKYRARGEDPVVLKNEVVRFVQHAMGQGYHVLLVPHVVPLDGRVFNNDEVYMREILAAFSPADSVSMPPSGLNASQLKYIISLCRFFIGARTHATIAAFSSSVPTISIAYSIKAKGINNDLFGHCRYVLETPDVGESSLKGALALLESDESQIRVALDQQVPKMREKAREGIQHFMRLL